MTSAVSSRRTGATLRWLLPALGLVAALLACCDGPSPVTKPEPAGVALDGDAIVWTTNVPTRGLVRFGRAPGQYNTVAYPVAAGRADRQATTEHRVPLLGVTAGETIYLQVLDEADNNVLSASPELSFTFVNGTSQRPMLRWTMIDVGFGDSHLLTMPNTGKRILIDGGERVDWPNVDRYLRDAAITDLDAVIATHAHADHIGGLVGSQGVASDGVLGAYNVDLFLEGPPPSASRSAYNEMLGILSARGIPRQTIHKGDTEATQSALAWDAEVRVTTLNAGNGQALGGDSDDDWLNNDSVVLRIGFGQVEFMLGGDAEGPAESSIVTTGGTLDSEVLKVHHHGVSDASSTTYLGAVNPRVGIIPIATYESFSGTLPSGTVVSRLRDRHIHIFACDRAEPLGISLSGDRGHNVTAVTDGVSYQIQVVTSASHHIPGGLALTRAESGCEENHP